MTNDCVAHKILVCALSMPWIAKLVEAVWPWTFLSKWLHLVINFSFYLELLRACGFFHPETLHSRERDKSRDKEKGQQKRNKESSKDGCGVDRRVPGTLGKGRQARRWRDVVQNNMRMIGLEKEMVIDGNTRRRRENGRDKILFVCLFCFVDPYGWSHKLTAIYTPTVTTVFSKPNAPSCWDKIANI